ncbi:MAG: hypothetical protein JWL95_244 [Gemmatimonadetes bacterium]|nr:hypothetical protein [Gemmatimonadota bacterium]
MQRFSAYLPARDGASDDRQPHRGSRVVGPLLDQREQLRIVSDTGEQASDLRELLEVFDAESVDAAFVYTFARYDLPHRDDPRADLDVVSCGVVKVLDGAGGARARRYPDMPWEPKAAFDAVTDWYE